MITGRVRGRDAVGSSLSGPFIYTLALGPTFSLTFDVDFCMYVSHDHSSPGGGTESQGHKPRLRIKISKDGSRSV